MKLADLTSHPHFRGVRYQGLFPNGYGVSVIHEDDGVHYEMAVLTHREGRKALLTYDTPVTDDVLRYLDEDAVGALADRVRALPPRVAAAWETTVSLTARGGIPSGEKATRDV